MSNTFPSPIDAYLDEARQAFDAAPPLPDREHLRQIAVDLDFDDEHSNQADALALELTQQAQPLLDSGRDARRQAAQLLRDACLLSPLRLQPHYLLASYYARRYGDKGQATDQAMAMSLAERALHIQPDHTPSRTLIEKMGDTPQDGISWKTAALIVLVIVTISGSLQLCHRYVMVDDVTDEQTEAVREYFEERGEPPR